MTPGIEYIAQGIAISAALLAGYHDGPAIRVFHQKGWESPRKNRQFHHSGAGIRALFVFLLALLPAPDIQLMLFTGATCACWVYMFFDMACGAWGHAGNLWYMGENDSHGNAWRRMFGQEAGQIKAGILFLIEVGLNLTYIFFIK